MTLLFLLLLITFGIAIFNFGILLTAKAFGVRIERFMVWMDVGFSIFRTKIGETVFGLGWLPLGGYCKITGMQAVEDEFEPLVDESALPAYDLRTKPPFQQFLISFSGPLSQFLLFFVAYALLGNLDDQHLPILAGLLGCTLAITLWPWILLKVFPAPNYTPDGLGFYLVRFFAMAVPFLGLLAAMGWLGYQLVPVFDYTINLFSGEYGISTFTAPLEAHDLSELGLSLFFMMGWMNLVPVPSLIGAYSIMNVYENLTGGRQSEQAKKFLRAMSTVFSFGLMGGAIYYFFF